MTILKTKLKKVRQSVISLCALFLYFSVAANENSISSVDVKEIKRYLLENEKRGVSGSFLIAEDDDVLLSIGVGFANRKAKVRNKPSTVFDIGSLTKQFTAAAILKLAELGKLTLDDTLEKYFEALPLDKKGITIHQLLSHTSGFGDYPANDFEKIASQDYLSNVFQSKIRVNSRNEYSYSNIGYTLLALIIEKVSNKTYEEFLNTTFFAPLGMDQTGFLLPNWHDNEVAHGYYKDFYDWGTSLDRYASDGISTVLLGNGGINSTALDLFKWSQALNKGTILSEVSIKQFFSPVTEVPSHTFGEKYKVHYAYGWNVRVTGGEEILFHNGNNGMYRSSYIWNSKSKTVIIYLANTESPNINWLAFEISNMINKENYTPLPVNYSPYRVINEFVEANSNISRQKLSKYFKSITGGAVPDKDTLNRLSSIYLRLNSHVEWAVELQRLNTELFPKDGNLWDSLGEGYLKVNELEKAKQSFNRALKLSPMANCSWCDNAKKKLEDISRLSEKAAKEL